MKASTRKTARLNFPALNPNTYLFYTDGPGYTFHISNVYPGPQIHFHESLRPDASFRLARPPRLNLIPN
jgi:hypothetical protein